MSAKGINKLWVFLVFFVSQSVVGQNPQVLNITIVFKSKLVVDSGCIKSNAIRINNLQLGDTIKSIRSDSIILKLEFVNHEYVLNVEQNADKHYYEISKGKVVIKQIGFISIINNLRYIHRCKPYTFLEMKKFDHIGSSRSIVILSKKCGSKILTSGEYNIKELLKNSCH
jgi:hypothetical protein